MVGFHVRSSRNIPHAALACTTRKKSRELSCFSFSWWRIVHSTFALLSFSYYILSESIYSLTLYLPVDFESQLSLCLSIIYLSDTFFGFLFCGLNFKRGNGYISWIWWLDQSEHSTASSGQSHIHNYKLENPRTQSK